jgi:hypothetical protein
MVDKYAMEKGFKRIVKTKNYIRIGPLREFWDMMEIKLDKISSEIFRTERSSRSFLKGGFVLIFQKERN